MMTFMRVNWNVRRFRVLLDLSITHDADFLIFPEAKFSFFFLTGFKTSSLVCNWISFFFSDGMEPVMTLFPPLAVAYLAALHLSLHLHLFGDLNVKTEFWLHWRNDELTFLIWLLQLMKFVQPPHFVLFIVICCITPFIIILIISLFNF